MRSFLRWGAMVVLIAILAPILFAIGTNPLLIFPIAWLLAYFVFRQAFPVARQTLVPVMAVQAGQLAWLMRLAIHGGGALALDVQPILLLAGMVWLFLTLSPIAAGALAVLQVYALVTGVVSVLQVDMGGLENGERLWGWDGAATSFFAHVWAILLLAMFLMGGRAVKPPAD